jgi:hypothetical protein
MNVIFLSMNNILFFTPVDDAWYSALTQGGGIHMYGSNETIPIYFRDDPVRTLGCVERYQYCNPNLSGNSSCTPLGGIFQVSQSGAQLYQDPIQQEHFNWSTSAIKSMAAGLSEIINRLGTSALLSRNTLRKGIQSSLPNNQWELEVENWYKVTLADVQRSILELSTGPIDPAIRRFLLRPNTTETKKICANQKIRSDSFVSVNLLGLTIIFAVGALIIITSLVLPIAVEHFQRRRNRYSSLEWTTNDTLQLQRLAHEAVGAGTWKGTIDDYPTTADREMLAVLDVTDPTHPRLEAAELEVTKIQTVTMGKEEDPVTSVTVAESSGPEDRRDVSWVESGRSLPFSTSDLGSSGSGVGGDVSAV